MRVCSEPGCPTVYDGTASRCSEHRSTADRARGTASERGYRSAGHASFRSAVLERDPVCVLCRRHPSTVGDHHPLSRRQLLARRLDPDDPRRGRGLCKRCHDRETARHQPGGWAARSL